jgi:pimeloyl-ACP methyl ester carboxylesterase
VVQEPLTSLADDVAATKRVLDLQQGPTLLVGHSYGGVVITEAGNAPNVAGLVYIAAFIPDQGQSALEACLEHFPITLSRLRFTSPRRGEVKGDAATRLIQPYRNPL